MASKSSNQATAAQQMEHTRTGTSVEILKAAFLDNLNYVVGRTLELATREQLYEALAQMAKSANTVTASLN